MPTDDRCYECRGLGDDYYYDDEGDLISACDTCPVHYEKMNDYDWSREDDEW